LHEGYSVRNVTDDIDLAIIGNAISSSNEEAQEILRRNIPYLSFAEALNNFFLHRSTNIVVAGTHGKTTTTSLLSWILEVAGLDPGFMIGGIPANFGLNFKLGRGNLMVLEGDEYNTAFFDKRPKFVHYNPHHVILTGIEFDHADIYRDEKEVLGAFSMLYPIIPADGYLLYCSDYPELRNTIGIQPYPCEGYGIKKTGPWNAEKISITSQGMDILVKKNETENATLFCPLTGDQNLQNITACVAMARYLGISWDKIKHALHTFKGIKKRQELIGCAGDIRVMVDFAHHPTAVRETLKGLKEAYPNTRIIAVFEPKTQTSRRNIFQKLYPDALRHADLVILAPVYNPYGLPESQLLSLETIKTDLAKWNNICYNMISYDLIADKLLEVMMPGDLVVFMSSGDFENVPVTFLSALQKKVSEGQ